MSQATADPAMTEKALKLYGDLAFRISKESYCVRLQVGCVIVKDRSIISMGYNGTVAGWDNCCEKNSNISPVESKLDVLHAEENAILKLARDGGGAAGATAICTDACCLSCAKMIYGSGIKYFYYARPYLDNRGIVRREGIEFLRSARVTVCRFVSAAE